MYKLNHKEFISMQEQPPVQPASTPTPTPVQQPSQPDTYPGKGIGIAGFILAFTGTQLIGLILSIIGYKKAKAAGVKHNLAFVGIILNSIFLGLALIIVPFLVITTLVSYNSITLRANTSSAQASAARVQKYAELYNAQYESYPTAIKDISSASVEFSLTELTEAPTSPNTVAFYTCGEDGNKIAYWDYTDSMAMYEYTGNATASSNCTLAT